MKKACDNKRLKLFIRRIVWFGLLIASVIIGIVLNNDNDGEYSSIIGIFVMCGAVPIVLIIFISTLLLSYKKYEYNGRIIEVYSGWYHHYMKYGGIKVDEHNTIQSFRRYGYPVHLMTEQV